MADNVLTRKLGPLPTWAWMAILTGLAVAYYLYKKHQEEAAGASSAEQVTTPTEGAGQVPDFIVQNQTPPGEVATIRVPEGGGTSSKGRPHCSDSKKAHALEGWTRLGNVSEAVAAKKMGAQVRFWNDAKCELRPWEGGSLGAGSALYVPSSWYHHHNPRAKANSEITPPAGATKAPRRPSKVGSA